MNRPTYSELEAQQSDLLKLHNALAASQSIWPNNWNQQVAMIAYHFHLMQAQLADAKQVANDCRIVADNAITEALAARKLNTLAINLIAASEEREGDDGERCYLVPAQEFDDLQELLND